MTTLPFRDHQPVAWAYHRNTSRWPFNVGIPELGEEHPLPPKEYPGALHYALPAPRRPDATLAEALRARLSCRRFAETGLSLETLATVLHAGYGVQQQMELGSLEFPLRPVPSAGALYPLELYLLAREVDGLEAGVYHYEIFTHELEEIRLVPLPPRFVEYLFMGQFYVGRAAAIVVMTAVVHRSLRKYGDRGYRYVLFEAGHVAQNLNLMGAACGLGSLNLGGFFDHDLAALLEVPLESEIPLYAIALGCPATHDPAVVRTPPE
jgi:SagB-type dehydrogenase family enzyme